MDEMLKHIAEEYRLKKSALLAEAIAKDYQILTNSKAVSLKSEMIAKRFYNGKPYSDPLPSYFIRAVTFKVSWYEFTSMKEAEILLNIVNLSLNKRDHVQKGIKVHSRDFGILEALSFLKDHHSDMANIKNAYKTLSLGLKFNI